MKKSAIFVFPLFLVTFFSNAQNNSSITSDELKTIRTYVKENFDGKLWFDYNACDFDSFQIFRGDSVYQGKLSFIDTCYVRTKNNGQAILYIETHNGALIKERSSLFQGEDLDFFREVHIKGAKEKIEKLSVMLNTLIEKIEQ